MAFTLCFCKLLWFQVTLSLCGILSSHISSSIWSAVSVHAVLCLYLRFLSFFSHLLWISNVNFFILLVFFNYYCSATLCSLTLIYCDFKQITEKLAKFCIFWSKTSLRTLYKIWLGSKLVNALRWRQLKSLAWRHARASEELLCVCGCVFLNGRDVTLPNGCI